MSATNARNFVVEYILSQEEPGSLETELMNTSNNEELIDKLMKMAASRDWPTGKFSQEDVQEAGTNLANQNRDIYDPQTFDNVATLFRAEGRNGGMW